MLSLSTSGHSRLQEKLDKWFWFILAIFPIVTYLIYLFGFYSGGFISTETVSENITTYAYNSPLSFSSFMLDLLTFYAGDGPVRDVLFSILGPGGIFPLFAQGWGFLSYFVYFISLHIVHVLVDVLVFIPRFAHKIMSKAINFGD